MLLALVETNCYKTVSTSVTKALHIETGDVSVATKYTFVKVTAAVDTGRGVVRMRANSCKI